MRRCARFTKSIGLGNKHSSWLVGRVSRQPGNQPSECHDIVPPASSSPGPFSSSEEKGRKKSKDLARCVAINYELMTCYRHVIDVFITSFCRGSPSQRWSRVYPFASHSDLNVDQVGGNSLQVRFDTKPRSIGNMQQSVLIWSDVVLGHRSCK